jgi:hypothetical protein
MRTYWATRRRDCEMGRVESMRLVGDDLIEDAKQSLHMQCEWGVIA